MPAYVIVEIDIHDQEAYEAYKKLTPATIVAFDGRFVVRGGEAVLLEGNRLAQRIVVLEFTSMEQATAWWNSETYGEAKAIRQRAASTNMILVEGV